MMKVKDKNDELLAEDVAAKQDARSDGQSDDALSQIQRRAYQLWQERGSDSLGNELDDWLQAEAEINARFDPVEQDQPRQIKQPRYSRHATAN